MRGIDIARGYWEAYGLPMLRRDFPGLLPLIAAGLTGPGSECYGYDDEISRDHDLEPGFILFLPPEDQVDRPTAFRLERAYAELPKSYGGLTRGPGNPSRRGVVRTRAYYVEQVGSGDGILTLRQWMNTPEHTLSEAVNGEIFYDGLGEVTALRQRLRRYPIDIRRKKLAGHMLMMAQAGLYNYPRCLNRSETGAAQLAVGEYVNHAMGAIFLLNEVYRPFYKWQFRALRGLQRLSLSAELMEYLITAGNDSGDREEKARVISDISRDVIAECVRQGLSSASGELLEQHAMSVNDGIVDHDLRNLNLLAGV